jgi:hypothetical protein
MNWKFEIISWVMKDGTRGKITVDLRWVAFYAVVLWLIFR